MIQYVMYCSWLNLKRDKVALGLSFVLPVLFFSIFAAIFGGMGGDNGGGRATSVAVVDLDQSEFSGKFIDTMKAQESLDVVLQQRGDKQAGQPYTEDAALLAVRTGQVAVALVLPKDLQNSVGFMANGEPLKLYYDPSNPIAKHTVTGLLQGVGMSAAPNMMMDRGINMLEQFGGTLTPAQKNVIAMAKAQRSTQEGNNNPVTVEAIDARAGMDEQASSEGNIVAYYAAGIGVMFLLFSMSGAGGGLLEEEESGTMDRLMISQLGMNRLILGKWLFFTCMGIAQLTVMFVWGALVFGMPLFDLKHLTGFAVITLPLGLAGAAFGLVLATLSKSRAQLSGMSTIIILIMSALGGSMVPRFVMPAYMDFAAKFTLNGWAIDGYLKVFWRSDPSHSWLDSVIYLMPEVGVISLIAVLFIGGALFLARRWQPA